MINTLGVSRGESFKELLGSRRDRRWWCVKCTETLKFRTVSMVVSVGHIVHILEEK